MKKHPTCIYCDQGEQDTPLLQFFYRGWHYWICPHHLAILLAHPEQLADKLTAFSQLKSSEAMA